MSNKTLEDVLKAAVASLAQAEPASAKHELERLQGLRARVEDALLDDGARREPLQEVLEAMSRLINEGYRVVPTRKHAPLFEELERIVRRL